MNSDDTVPLVLNAVQIGYGGVKGRIRHALNAR